jgi:hypothetical protein
MAAETLKKHLYTLWFNLIALKNEKDEQLKNSIRATVQLQFEILKNNKISFVIQNQVIALAEFGMGFDENINTILGGN